MRYLTLGEVVALHRGVIRATGGATGIRDLRALESAVAQPRATFGGDDLYPGVIGKAGALGFSLVMDHPFADGNKRAGHAAMETFLVLNGNAWIELSGAVSAAAPVQPGLILYRSPGTSFTPGNALDGNERDGAAESIDSAPCTETKTERDERDQDSLLAAPLLGGPLARALPLDASGPDTCWAASVAR